MEGAIKHRVAWIALVVGVGASALWTRTYPDKPYTPSQSDVIVVPGGAVDAPVVNRPTDVDTVVQTPVEAAPNPAVDQRSPRDLQAVVREEARDPAWADASEAAIKTALGGARHVGGNNPLEVRCAATLCEVSGVAAMSATPDNINAARRELESADLQQALARRGLLAAGSSFGSGRSVRAFAIYYRRGSAG